MNRHLKFVTGGGLLIALFGGASLFYFSPTAMIEKKGVTDSLGNEAFQVAQISEPEKEELKLSEKCHQIVSLGIETGTSKKRFLV
jgi:hypothetical protein